MLKNFQYLQWTESLIIGELILSFYNDWESVRDKHGGPAMNVNINMKLWWKIKLRDKMKGRVELRVKHWKWKIYHSIEVRHKQYCQKYRIWIESTLIAHSRKTDQEQLWWRRVLPIGWRPCLWSTSPSSINMFCPTYSS